MGGEGELTEGEEEEGRHPLVFEPLPSLHAVVFSYAQVGGGVLSNGASERAHCGRKHRGKQAEMGTATRTNNRKENIFPGGGGLWCHNRERQNIDSKTELQ